MGRTTVPGVGAPKGSINIAWTVVAGGRRKTGHVQYIPGSSVPADGSERRSFGAEMVKKGESCLGNSCAEKEHWGGLVHHLSRHHCWDPAMKTRKANKIIALSQEFWEHSTPKFALSIGTSGSEKVKGGGGNWEMGRGLVELEYP